MTPKRELQATPPRWAEWLLRLTLKRADRESVSGDLLEEYRDTVVPARGQSAADVWYLRQVAGFMWRATWVWAVLFSGAFVIRQAVDFFIPTHEFYVRSFWTTYTAVALWRRRRSGARGDRDRSSPASSSRS
jgi:hypothetical protein